METITLKLPREMMDAATRLARDRDTSLGQVLRDAMTAELRRAGRNAKTPNRADEQLIVPLRALLAADFGQARSWNDLDARLRAKGYALREAGGGLALHSHPEGARLCKASELGHAYAALMRQFKAPFPGHAHRYLARHLPGPAGQPGRVTVADVIDTDEDLPADAPSCGLSRDDPRFSPS